MRNSVDECGYKFPTPCLEPNNALSVVHRDFYTFIIRYEHGLVSGSATVVPGEASDTGSVALCRLLPLSGLRVSHLSFGGFWGADGGG